jgi:hypothetical protein
MAALPFYRSIYLTRYVYYAGFATAGLFVLSFFSPVFFTLAYALLLFTGIAVLIDMRITVQQKSHGGRTPVARPFQQWRQQ